MSNQDPYIIKTDTTEVRIYNPHFGDDRTCACGHSYERHFDPFEDNAAVGCKYCQCYDFREPEGTLGDALRHLELLDGDTEVKNSLRRILIDALEKVRNLKADWTEGVITKPGRGGREERSYILSGAVYDSILRTQNKLTGYPLPEDGDSETG